MSKFCQSMLPQSGPPSPRLPIKWSMTRECARSVRCHHRAPHPGTERARYNSLASAFLLRNGSSFLIAPSRALMGAVVFALSTLVGCIQPATVIDNSPSPLGLADTTAVPTTAATPPATTPPTQGASTQPPTAPPPGPTPSAT